MNKTKSVVDRIKTVLGIALVATLAGCVGYVDGGYSGAVIVPEPDVYVFGGGFSERGRDAHDFSRRGSESRAVAHPAARPAARPVGGERGGKR